MHGKQGCGDQAPVTTRHVQMQLASFEFPRLCLDKGLLQMTQPSSSLTTSLPTSQPAVRATKSFVFGLNPPHSVVYLGQDKQDWLMLLHLVASRRPAHLQHDYTTILLQVGDVMPVHTFPTMWEAATMIMVGKSKQGDAWIEGPGDASCPKLCCNEKLKVSDVYLAPANNQFVALSLTAKYSIRPAKGDRVVVT